LVLAASVAVGLGCGGKGASPGPDSPKPEIVIPPSVASGDRSAADKEQPEWTGAPYGKPEITVNRTEGGFDVSIHVKQRAGMAVPTAAVPFTAERYAFTLASAAGELSEADVFGSGMAMDLDGDGETTGVFPVACEGGIARVGEVGVSPIGQGGSNGYVYHSTSGVPKVTRLGEDGACMVLYNPCDKPPVSIGFCPPGEPMNLMTVPGPTLQVLLVEVVPNAGTTPAFSIEDVTLGGAHQDAAQHTTYIFDGTTQTPTWNAVLWIMLPLDAAAPEQQVGLRIAVPEGDTTQRSVMAGVNASRAEGERRRLPFATQPLGSAAPPEGSRQDD